MQLRVTSEIAALILSWMWVAVPIQKRDFVWRRMEKIVVVWIQALVRGMFLLEVPRIQLITLCAILSWFPTVKTNLNKFENLKFKEFSSRNTPISH